MQAVTMQGKGRPVTPGRLTYDPQTGQVRFFVDYCPACSAKILMTKEEIQTLAKRHNRAKKSFKYRLLHRLLDNMGD